MTTTIRVHPPSAPRVVADERAIVLPFRLHADAVEELLEALPPVVEPPRFDALAGTPPWVDAPLRTQLPLLPGVQVEVAVPCPHTARTGTPPT